MSLSKQAVLALALLLTGVSPAFGAEPEPPAEAPIVPPKLLKVDPIKKGVGARRGLVHKVVIELVIGVDGKTSELKVIAGPGDAWNKAVIEAFSKAQFKPATRGGQPIPTRIRIPVTVGEPPAYMARGRRIPEPIPVVKKAVTGIIKERGTRKPLPGVTIVIDKTDKTVVTDKDGKFLIEGLPKGKYRLVIPGADYEPYIQNIKVPQLDMAISLMPAGDVRYRTVIKARTADAARVVIPVAQAREVPGSNGDPVKVIESLPGVARPASAGPAAGQIIVRGSAPEDTLFYIDGMPLFQLYHFGNIYSVVQDEWIRDIDFRPGAFSTEYGNATGGMINVSLADIKDDGIHGHVDINVYHAAFMLTAPVSEDWTIGAAFRRSYFDVILGAVLPEDGPFAFTAAPAYYDYQVRADYRPSELEVFRLLIFGSDDLLSVALDGPTDSNPTADGFRFKRQFHQIQATYTVQLEDDLSMFAGLSTGWQGFNLGIGGGRSFDLAFCPLVLRTDMEWRPRKDFKLRGGFRGYFQRFRVEADLPPPTKEGEIGGQNEDDIAALEEDFTLQLSLWAEASWSPIEEIQVVAGFRFSGWTLYYQEWGLDPRLTVHFDVTDTTRISVAGGLNHQIPQPDEYSITFGNPNLTAERSAYANLSVSQRVGDFLRIELQAYYKALDNLISPTPFGSDTPYDNAGTGYVVGGELLVQLSSKWVDGWISYSLSRSRRTDRPGAPERPFSVDQTHVLALVLGVNLPDDWRIGARFRYSTGNPFTPLKAAYYDSSDDVYVPAPAGATLSGRIDDFFQLDLRIDKKFTFDDWALNLYLEITNATNRANTEQAGYSFDYSTRSDIVGLPIVPGLGIRAQF